MNSTATVLSIMIASALCACASPPAAQCKVEQFGRLARVDGRLVVTNHKPAELHCKAMELEKDPFWRMGEGIYIARSYDRSEDPRTRAQTIYDPMVGWHP